MGRLERQALDTRVGTVQVWRGGGGPPLVYLHSAAGEADTGMALLDDLADDYAVIAPLFPGFGDSDGLDRIDDIEDAVFHLLDVWDRLGLDAPVVVGLSLGGWMAVELAARYPERVSTLVLVNPVGLHIDGAPIGDIFGRSPGELAHDFFADQTFPVAQLMHGLAEISADIGRRIELPWEVVEPYVSRLAAAARLGWNPYLHDPKLPKLLWRVAAPTLVVRGVDDTLVPAAHAEAYASQIEGARLVELAEAAHLAAWERPAEVATEIRRFVEEVA